MSTGLTDETLVQLDGLSGAARFAYELCGVEAEPVDAAAVAAAAFDDDPDRVWDELGSLRGDACYRVAVHPHLPERCQWGFANSGDRSAVSALCDAAHTPTAIVDHLVATGHPAALGHPNVSEQLLWDHAFGDEAGHVARNPTVPEHLLYRLVRHHRGGTAARKIARLVANNPAATALVLDELMGWDFDDDWFTASMLAEHPNTPRWSIIAALKTAPPGGYTHRARARFGIRP